MRLYERPLFFSFHFAYCLGMPHLQHSTSGRRLSRLVPILLRPLETSHLKWKEQEPERDKANARCKLPGE